MFNNHGYRVSSIQHPESKIEYRKPVNPVGTTRAKITKKCKTKPIYRITK